MSREPPHAGDDPHAGISAQRVLVGGFSQGACLASEFVARNPTRYGGLAVLSGGLIGESIDLDDYVSRAVAAVDGDPTDALAGTPTFLGCSDVDERIYERTGHGINEEEMAVVSGLVADPA